jgi:putative inorganic carbon (hco3(-)) transporter
MKLLKILLFGAILSLSMGEILRVDLGNDIAFRMLDVLVLFSSIVFIIFCFKKREFPNSKLQKPILIFISLSIISLIYNSLSLNTEQLLKSSLYILRWMSYIGVYFILLSIDTKFMHILKKSLIIVGIAILVFGYIQYIFYPDLRNLFYLGWDEHNYRMFSVFLDPNFAGAIFVLFFIYMASLTEAKVRKREFEWILIYCGVMIINLIAIMLTYSRSAILMLIVSIFTYLFLINKKKYLALVIGIISLILIILVPTFNKENTNLFRTTSSFARIDSYRNAFEIYREHPILGIGFNAYRYAQQSYGFRNDQSEFPNHADAGVDSSLLFVLVTTGLQGFIVYLYMWYLILKNALVKRVKSNSLQSIVVISSCTGLFVNSFFINSLFYPFIMLWIWVMVGLMERE